MQKSPHSEDLNEEGTNYTPGNYEMATNTVDVCVCRVKNGKLEVLMVKRARPPFRDHWAIPGGFIDIGEKEGMLAAAERELEEETGIRGLPLWQLATYGGPTRDPRYRVITTAYFTIPSKSTIESITVKPQDTDEIKETTWLAVDELPDNIAFDHAVILEDLKYRLYRDIQFDPIAFRFLDAEFSFAEAQEVYEAILGKKLLAPNFRRKLKSQYYLEETGNTQPSNGGRRSKLLRFQGKKEQF